MVARDALLSLFGHHTDWHVVKARLKLVWVNDVGGNGHVFYLDVRCDNPVRRLGPRQVRPVDRSSRKVYCGGGARPIAIAFGASFRFRLRGNFLRFRLWFAPIRAIGLGVQSRWGTDSTGSLSLRRLLLQVMEVAQEAGLYAELVFVLVHAVLSLLLFLVRGAALLGVEFRFEVTLVLGRSSR